MGRPKGGAASSSKKPKAKQKQRGGVDFKVPPAHRFCSLRDLILRRRVKPFSWRSQKYKHKVGRKLPPPKNATNTEIKSKGTATSTFFFSIPFGLVALQLELRCNNAQFTSLGFCIVNSCCVCVQRLCCRSRAWRRRGRAWQ